MTDSAVRPGRSETLATRADFGVTVVAGLTGAALARPDVLSDEEGAELLSTPAGTPGSSASPSF